MQWLYYESVDSNGSFQRYTQSNSAIQSLNANTSFGQVNGMGTIANSQGPILSRLTGVGAGNTGSTNTAVRRKNPNLRNILIFFFFLTWQEWCRSSLSTSSATVQ
jgi:hypothetical protein